MAQAKVDDNDDAVNVGWVKARLMLSASLPAAVPTASALALTAPLTLALRVRRPDVSTVDSEEGQKIEGSSIRTIPPQISKKIVI